MAQEDVATEPSTISSADSLPDDNSYHAR